MGASIDRINMLKMFLTLSRRHKQIIAVAVDYCSLTFALWSALVIRFETFSPNLTNYRWLILVAPLLAIPVFVKLGLYRAVIRFMEDKVAFVVVGGVSFSVLLLVFVMVFTNSMAGVSRGVLAIYWLLAIIYVGATRFVARHYFLGLERSHDARKRVAIYGAGRSGRQLAYALKAGNEYLPVAFFDDNVQLQNTELGGLRIYPPAELSSLLAAKGIDEILLAMPAISKSRQAEIITHLEDLLCKVRLIPRMSELINGQASIDAIRDVEIDDILGRDVVAPDERLLGQCVTGKSVLVSGAGGSIGSEICKQVVLLGPTRLVLIELSEFALYTVEQELNALCLRLNLTVEIIPLLGSVLHRQRNERVIKSFGVQTIYHAAAYKHVPLVEHNPAEGLVNNAIGTQRMAQAALAAEVENFVLISTDKAVRPTNVMGASKRLSELILQGLSRLGGKTRFAIVRFGNVLDSSGSVVPLFRRQIEAGGPITLTHPEITRYFMTIPEAAQLVIQAGSMGDGGDVFVLDMGQPVKIFDLACRMIRLSGKTIQDEEHPHGDIAIKVVGLRPGEKLYEELLIGENVEGTTHPLIMRAHEHEISWFVLEEKLEELIRVCRDFDYETVLTLLAELVKEYAPAKHGKNELLWYLLTQPQSSIRAVH